MEDEKKTVGRDTSEPIRSGRSCKTSASGSNDQGTENPPASTVGNVKNPKEETPRKFLLTFRADGYRKKKIYITCTEAELHGCKEQWAMLLEEQMGRGPWVCTDVREATGATTSTTGRGGDSG